MNLKVFQKILPVSKKQVNIFDAKADQILKHLKVYDGGKKFQEDDIEDFLPSSNNEDDDRRNRQYEQDGRY